MIKPSWILFLFCTLIAGQDLQNRSIAHLQVDVSKHWFVPAWSITNLRVKAPNNTNVFVGVGFRGKSWWVEQMVQKQWNGDGGLTALDTRVVKRWGQKQKTVSYFEAGPFLSQKGFFWSSYTDTVVWRKLGLGVGTENVHKPGPDMVAIGPRVALSLGRFAGFDISTTGEFRFVPFEQPTKIGGHPREIRLYVLFNKRIALADRK